MKHAFVICAYKRSKYLERCVRSLLAQTVEANIYITTSTPNNYIETIANRYNIKLFVRNGSSDIRDDWNYACDTIDAEWITVAHQDDVYSKYYLEEVLCAISKYDDGIIAFTDYRPIIGGQVSMDINCRIRHLLRSPMRIPMLANSKFFKKYILAFGNSICCPSVCYHKKVINGSIFTSNLKFSLDWDTYLKFSKMDGRFIYVDKTLTYYRIHNKATTAAFINNNTRQNDDIYMFGQFWPKFVVKLIMKIYVKAYEAYK